MSRIVDKFKDLTSQVSGIFFLDQSTVWTLSLFNNRFKFFNILEI